MSDEQIKITYHALISYSSEDSEIAKNLVKNLEDRGVICWISYRDITVGERYPSKIAENLEKSEAVILLLTKNSLASVHVEREGILAIDRKKNLYPLMFDPDKQLLGNSNPRLKSLDYVTSGIQALELHATDNLNQDTYQKLAERLLADSILPRKTSSTSEPKRTDESEQKFKKTNTETKAFSKKLLFLIFTLMLTGIYITYTNYSRQNLITNETLTPRAEGRIGYLPKLILVSSDTFTIGNTISASLDSESDEIPRDNVLVENFEISQTEVTISEFNYYLVENGFEPLENTSGEAQLPITSIDWIQAIEYTKWLSSATGDVYRLPTEAEWEYSAKFRTHSADDGKAYSNKDTSGSFDEMLTDDTAIILNTHNKVAEWTCSAYTSNYNGRESLCTNASSDDYRVIRGGDWRSGSREMQTTFRDYNTKSYSSPNLGFRVVREQGN